MAPPPVPAPAPLARGARPPEPCFEPSAQEVERAATPSVVEEATEAASPREGLAATQDKEPHISPLRADALVVDLESVKAQLAAGVAVRKHCTDGRIRQRVLVLSAAGDRLGWKRGQAEAKMVALKDVLEVRAATELDPTTVGGAKRSAGMAGTETLRKSALGPEVGLQAFSLILQDRTLDFQCATPLEAKKIHAALKVLVVQAKR